MNRPVPRLTGWSGGVLLLLCVSTAHAERGWNDEPPTPYPAPAPARAAAAQAAPTATAAATPVAASAQVTHPLPHPPAATPAQALPPPPAPGPEPRPDLSARPPHTPSSGTTPGADLPGNGRYATGTVAAPEAAAFTSPVLADDGTIYVGGAYTPPSRALSPAPPGPAGARPLPAGAPSAPVAGSGMTGSAGQPRPLITREDMERAGRAVQQAVDQTLQGIIEGTEALTGPDARKPIQVPQLLPEDASCEEMYAAVSALLPRSAPTRPGFYDEPVNAAAGLLGTAYERAYYLWGVTEYMRLAELRHTQTIAAQVEQLRQRMAARNCFVR